LLQKLGVITIYKKLVPLVSGCCIKIKDYKFILINSNDTLGRQHFTALHEIYHLFIQDNLNSRICYTGEFNKKDKEEFNADIFSANVLIPKDGILSKIPESEMIKNKISMTTLLDIEQYYSCSHSALLVQLEKMDLIDNSKKEDLKQNIKAKAYQYGYDTSLYEPGNDQLIIGDYGALAKKLFDNEIISESDYLNLMMDIGKEVG